MSGRPDDKNDALEALQNARDAIREIAEDIGETRRVGIVQDALHRADSEIVRLERELESWKIVAHAAPSTPQSAGGLLTERVTRMLDELQRVHVAVTAGTGYDPEKYSSTYSEAAALIRDLTMPSATLSIVAAARFVLRRYIWQAQNPSAPIAAAASLDSAMVKLRDAFVTAGEPDYRTTNNAPDSETTR